MPVYPANRVLIQANSTNRDGRIRLFFSGQTIAPGIFSPPVLADGFRGFVQPIRVSQQGDQFDGTEEFHRVWPGPAWRPQFSRADENGNIVRLTEWTGRNLPTGASRSAEEPRVGTEAVLKRQAGKVVFSRALRHCV